MLEGTVRLTNHSEAQTRAQARRSPHITRWSAIVAGILVALIATASVVALQRYADERRQAEVLVAHSEALVNQLKRLELEVESVQMLAPESRQQAEAIRDNVGQALEQLVQLDPHSTAQNHMRTTIHQYLDDNRELFRLFMIGQPKKALEWDESHADPSYDAIFDGTASASAIYRREAQQAGTAAMAGAILTMAMAAFMIGLVFWRFERSQRVVVELATEQRALRKSEDRFRALVRNASDVIVIVDTEGMLQYHSPALQQLWGYAPEDVQDQHIWTLIRPQEKTTAETLLVEIVRTPGLTITTELCCQHPDGSWQNFEVIANNLLEESGIGGIVLTFHDITDHKRFEQELTHLAFHDTLSQLPNRALLMDRLERALARAERRNTSIAALFLDLDNFKVINDSLGHQVGDRLLVAVAERLHGCIRPDDTLARLGGDEFVIVLEEFAEVNDVLNVAERIARELQDPIVLDGQKLFASASIGVTISTPYQSKPDTLLRDADLAMYRAKSNGKARYAIFDQSMSAAAIARLELETDLRRALERGELRVYYQSMMDLVTGQVREVEALVRWEHPQRGLISPASFIPLAEETGLILPLGRWVLHEACQQLRTWQLQYPTQSQLRVSVNLSARQFQHPQLIDDIATVLRETGLNPSDLKLEITESVIMQDTTLTSDMLRQLKGLGVQLAIDDFGTGYSSLASLQRFPLDVLKIDRSFVERLGIDPEGEAIVRAIITVAKALHLAVTGEGIETTEQLDLLRSLGCDLGQGYYISRPGPSEAAATLLAGSCADDHLTFEELHQQPC